MRKGTLLEPVIPPVKRGPVPPDAACQEAAPAGVDFYVACRRPATAIVKHKKDRRAYYMCEPCAHHNVRNRGGLRLEEWGPQWDDIAEELALLLPSAVVFVEGGGAAPVHLAIVFTPDGRSYFAGDANDQWGIDFYATKSDVEEGRNAGGVDTHLPSAVTDQRAVAVNIAAAILRHEMFLLEEG